VIKKKAMPKLPSIIFTDIDGVWTDGGMYYDQLGNELKKFTTTDSAGVLFANLLKIPIAIITGENTEIVTKRGVKLKIDYVFQGAVNKLEIASELCRAHNITLHDAAYIGDDINDIPLLKKVGFSACPQNAPSYIKEIVNYITKTKGGEGAFREFVEQILLLNGALTETIQLATNYYLEKGIGK
jgi:YrbI family 3-deoxy-D-manno-octulosonate 8-phosphate phosphatase